jgi:hypothetical protein
MVDVVIDVEPLVTRPPISNSLVPVLITNVPVGAPQSMVPSINVERSSHIGNWGYAALAVIPILLFLYYCNFRYSCISCQSNDDDDDNSNVGTMIGRIVDTTHDENRTVISGLHTLSSVPQGPEHYPMHRDTIPRRLSPVHDWDIDPNLLSECGTTICNTIITGNSSDRPPDTLPVREVHNLRDDMIQMLNKIEQQMQSPPLTPSPTQPQLSSSSSSAVPSDEVIVTNIETPQAQALHRTNEPELSGTGKIQNDSELDENDRITSAPMVDAILISNLGDDEDIPNDTTKAEGNVAATDPDGGHNTLENELGNEDTIEDGTTTIFNMSATDDEGAP